ncbi:MAG: ABC transporter permease [Acidobacteria bacterium]|nr:ABC transporter permease [Acidobacteriota bacterium]
MDLRDVKLRARALLAPRQAERDLRDELAFHVDREARKLIDEGMAPATARARAHARFGSVPLVADECRDQRGTAFVDDALRDLRCAVRSFAHAPLASATVVATIAIGLGVVAVLFTFLNTFLFRTDRVPDVEQFYAVERLQPGTDGQSSLTRADFESLRRDTSVFTDAYAAVSGIDLRVDGRAMAVTLVTASFFDLVRVRPSMGRALTAADDAPNGGNPVIVLSDKGWHRRFDRDPDVIGRTVLVGGVPFTVVGVMPEGFRGLVVGAPDFWAPLAQLGAFRPNQRGRESSAVVEIAGRLKPGVSGDSARAQLRAWSANAPASTAERRAAAAATIDVLPHRGTVPRPMEAVMLFAPLFIAFGLILLIGCANVANLLLARGVARQREIGIRLSIGASRGRIVRQLMTESLLLALVAAAGGYVVSRLALTGAVVWVVGMMPADIWDVSLNVPAADWRVALFLVAAAVASTALFALLPALQATRIDPVRTLRGELVRDARPGRARNALIGVQVFASALLLIGASIFLRSGMASSQYDQGFRTADTVMIELVNEPTRTAMLQAIAADAAITQYAAVRPGMLDTLPGLATIGQGKTPLRCKFVSGDYFGVMGVPMLRGRTFTPAERDGAPVVIVSESTARALWPNGNAIGETFRLEPDRPSEGQPEDQPAFSSHLVTVIGVSRDVTGSRFTGNKPGVFMPTSLDAPDTAAMVRIAGDPDLARRTLIEHFIKIDPNLGRIVTMRTVARLEKVFLTIAFSIAVALGALALLLTVSGLFSVLSYLVAQRTKEIGLRMALGAPSRAVTRLVLAQTARPVLYGLVAGTVLAAALATVLLSTPFGAFISPIVHVADPVAYLASVVIIVAACVAAAALPATRAVRLDPMRALREE